MEHYLEWLERADPDARAVGDDSGSRLTYAQLLDAAARQAAVMAEATRYSYLFIPAQRNADFVVQLIASAYAGKTAVPYDPETPDLLLEDLREMTRSSEIWSTDHWLPLSGAVESGAATVDRRDPAVTPVLLFTSGTSGRPKGVPISQKNLHHSALAISDYLAYAQHRSAAIILPLHYSYALLSQLFCMFFVGGYSHLFANTRNPIKISQQCADLNLDTICGVPSTFHAFDAMHQMSPYTFDSIRVVCSAGAAFDQDRRDAVLRLFPNAILFNNYGMTEATPRISYIRSDDPNFLKGSCGRPIQGLSIQVLDEQSHKPVDDGVAGIVSIKGENVFSGYLNNDAANAEAFSADGYLLSGDIGYMDDGYLYLKGRADEVFNVGGEKVSPVEIENCLRKHPSVVDCGVYPFEDRQRGRLAFAYVIQHETVSKRELHNHLKTLLPPSRLPWRYYQVNELPMTTNGKLQRSRLQPDAEFVLGEIK